MKLYWFLLFLFALSCKPHQEPPAISFYYWKTKFKLENTESTILKEQHTEKIYLRYFDIGLKNGEAFPVSAVTFDEIPSQEIIPVIYIKNEVVLSQKTDVTALAQHIVDYVQQINQHYGLNTRELQVDCDWTLTSKQKFFALLRELKKQTTAKISATIRLHQVKYFEKTGIPPVDYGVLMYYNMGQLSANRINSIYDRNTASTYIASLARYPLPLQVALPIFSWGIHIRDSKVINLINRLSEKDLADPLLFERQADGKFKILQEGYYFGQLFAPDDLIKLENISAEMLEDMAADLHDHLKKKPTEIIFYDLDRKNIQHYEHDIFEKISTRFN